MQQKRQVHYGTHTFPLHSPAGSRPGVCLRPP
uniref:Uncharacterized protein n=1 Tax=Anguilla anguilla TaxID=7936 RepID=A0A0E9RNA4_ANGAN